MTKEQLLQLGREILGWCAERKYKYVLGEEYPDYYVKASVKMLDGDKKMVTIGTWMSEKNARKEVELWSSAIGK